MGDVLWQSGLVVHTPCGLRWAGQQGRMFCSCRYVELSRSLAFPGSSLFTPEGSSRWTFELDLIELELPRPMPYAAWNSTPVVLELFSGRCCILSCRTDRSERWLWTTCGLWCLQLSGVTSISFSYTVDEGALAAKAWRAQCFHMWHMRRL